MVDWHRAGQAALENGQNPLKSVMDMPLPEPPEQLWDLLESVPHHYQRINMMCSDWEQSSPGANK